MKRRINLRYNFFVDFLLFLAIIFGLMSLMPTQSEMTPAVNEHSKVVSYYDQGLSVLTSFVTDTSTQSKSGIKHFEFCDSATSSHGTVRWSADITADFSKTDSGYICTGGEALIYVYNTTWYEVSRELTFDGDTAICNIVIGKRYFYIPTSKDTFTLTFTCNPDGSLT